MVRFADDFKIRYPDSTVIIPETGEQLQKLMNTLIEESTKVGLKNKFYKNNNVGFDPKKNKNRHMRIHKHEKCTFQP